MGFFNANIHQCLNTGGHMKFTRLDITNKKVTRKDFLNQGNKCFVLPDNVPDFRLPRNQLHETNNRGGLAAAMRPNKVGSTQGKPVYDVNVIGVPTLSFVASETFAKEHILEAFDNIYHLLGLNDRKGEKQFDEIVVPYKGGVPAFGGGIAGAMPKELKKEIDDQMALLETHLNQNQNAPYSQKLKAVRNLPARFRLAYFNGLNGKDKDANKQQGVTDGTANKPTASKSSSNNKSFDWLALLLTAASFALLGYLNPFGFVITTLSSLVLPAIATSVLAVAAGMLMSSIARSVNGFISGSKPQPSKETQTNKPENAKVDIEEPPKSILFSNKHAAKKQTGKHVYFAEFNDMCVFRNAHSNIGEKQTRKNAPSRSRS